MRRPLGIVAISLIVVIGQAVSQTRPQVNQTPPQAIRVQPYGSAYRELRPNAPTVNVMLNISPVDGRNMGTLPNAYIWFSKGERGMVVGDYQYLMRGRDWTRLYPLDAEASAAIRQAVGPVTERPKGHPFWRHLRHGMKKAALWTLRMIADQ